VDYLIRNRRFLYHKYHTVDEDLAELDEEEQLNDNNGEDVVADEDEIMQDFEEELLREDPTPVEAPAVKLAEAEREKKINSIDVGKTLKKLVFMKDAKAKKLAYLIENDFPEADQKADRLTDEVND
jgi:hypothetical protein